MIKFKEFDVGDADYKERMEQFQTEHPTAEFVQNMHYGKIWFKYEPSDTSVTTDKLSVEKFQEHLFPYKKEMVQKIIDEKMQLVTVDEFLKLEKEYLTAVRENDKLKEQLDTAKKALTEINSTKGLFRGGEIHKFLPTEYEQIGLIHYHPLEGFISKVECQTCGKELKVNSEFFSMAYPFCSLECWRNYTKYEGEVEE